MSLKLVKALEERKKKKLVVGPNRNRVCPDPSKSFLCFRAIGHHSRISKNAFRVSVTKFGHNDLKEMNLGGRTSVMRKTLHLAMHI